MLIRDRADRAETRAAITLGAVGVMGGLVAGTFGLWQQQDANPWLLAGTLVAAAILLLKSARDSLRALDSLSGNELNPEAALDLAKMPDDEATRFELVARTWEYYQALPLTNERLYFAQRAQKNLAFAVIMWCAASAFLFLTTHGLVNLGFGVEVASAVLALIVSFFLDWLDEKVTGLWKKN